jgi:hypothetical protein
VHFSGGCWKNGVVQFQMVPSSPSSCRCKNPQSHSFTRPSPRKLLIILLSFEALVLTEPAFAIHSPVKSSVVVNCELQPNKLPLFGAGLSNSTEAASLTRVYATCLRYNAVFSPRFVEPCSFRLHFPSLVPVSCAASSSVIAVSYFGTKVATSQS